MCANCCYKKKEVQHDPYEDWPDGRREEETVLNKPADAIDPVEGGEEAVVAVYQDASFEDEKPMKSPSELGEIV